MRHVLDAATDEWQTLDWFVPPRPTRAQREAARRACKRLAEQGLLEIGYRRIYEGSGEVLAESPRTGNVVVSLMVRRAKQREEAR